ncbi:MAG: hypothetical protein OXH70_19025 [Acidobacteria bacterium]|nr:hypothetical protein [Acidobacteriota bacterium]
MAFDRSPPEAGRAFPRGLVLGFTMAEIAILIIFVLLLVLAAMLARESDKREQAESELARHEEVREIFEEEELPEDPVVLRSVLVERVERHYAADNWRELVRELAPAAPEPSPQELVEQIQESEIGRMSPDEAERLLEAHREVEKADAHAELEQALQEAGVSSPGGIRDMAAATRAADEQGMTPGEIRETIENRAAWDEAVDDAGRSAEPEELRELAEAVRAAAERGLSPEQVAEAVETQREFVEALAGEGREATEEAVRETIQDAHLWREVGGEEVAPLKDRLEEVLAERDQEREKAENLRERLRSLGGGTDHPSCWYQPDGITTAYLFDVALTARGRLVVDFAATSPGHVLDASGRRLGTTEEARAFLPVGSVRLQELLSPGDFLRQTKPVHDWSIDNEPECRFFVRVFDRTEASQKQLYKDQLQMVEQPFYKLLVEGSGLPPGLARTVGQ